MKPTLPEKQGLLRSLPYSSHSARVGADMQMNLADGSEHLRLGSIANGPKALWRLALENHVTRFEIRANDGDIGQDVKRDGGTA